jgi:protein-S-isoprenylcysteine O-methyltransferase Ste14
MWSRPCGAVWQERMSNNYSVWAARWRVPLGFAFAIAYVVLSRPALRFLIVGGIVAFLGVALRAVAAGYIEKSRSLATAGPFSYTRNPLYLGSFILGAGFAIASASWIVAAIFGALFVSIYVPVMRSEESFLRWKFGRDFEEYARAVPLFIPVPGRRFRGVGNFRWARYRGNREYNAAIGYVLMIVFLMVKLALR